MSGGKFSSALASEASSHTENSKAPAERLQGRFRAAANCWQGFAIARSPADGGCLFAAEPLQPRPCF